MKMQKMPNRLIEKIERMLSIYNGAFVFKNVMNFKGPISHLNNVLTLYYILRYRSHNKILYYKSCLWTLLNSIG